MPKTPSASAAQSRSAVEPREDILEVDQIQGNILAGFNKDFQRFLFLRVNDREVTKGWLKAIAPRIAKTAEVLSFNQLFRSLRRRRGGDPEGLVATWINIAFTFDGIGKLTSEAEAARFVGLDASFTFGLHQRSTLLGDPVTPGAVGHTSQWVVGGEHNLSDILLIIASDDAVLLAKEVERLRAEVETLPRGLGGRPALEIIFDQKGETRPDKPGHEHFGFKDGVSQPGVRGRVSRAAGDFLTPRLISPGDPLAGSFARPGQRLVWPGQFVIGYNRQSGDDALKPAKPVKPRPPWARNGSFLVVRRLRQDVAGFWRFVTTEATSLAQKPGFAGMTPERLGALLVGRWQSGAPVMRAPQADVPALAVDSFANNHFSYNQDSQPVSLTIPDYPGDTFPQAKSDPRGIVCPNIAHIRKVNPRDLGTDTGGTNDMLTRLVLRRGVPFGTPVLDPSSPTAAELQEERGLMFLAYQTSISEQFEFLMNHWANSLNQPQQGGHDPLIGQHEDSPGNRVRQIELLGEDGSMETISLPSEWIIPTGGGYFFSPSVSALRDVIGA